jgi:hypothetical protein
LFADASPGQFGPTGQTYRETVRGDKRVNSVCVTGGTLLSSIYKVINRRESEDATDQSVGVVAVISDHGKGIGYAAAFAFYSWWVK